MTKRFALFRGKKGQLVGHPGQTLAGASYICQRQLPIEPEQMRGFGEPGYDGPELADLYEPTLQIIELTQLNTRHLDKAVRAGHLDRSAIFHFQSAADAEASRPKLEASLVEQVKRAAAAKADAAKKLAARRPESSAVDEALEAERALLVSLDEIDANSGDEPIPSTERPVAEIGPDAIEGARK